MALVTIVHDDVNRANANGKMHLEVYLHAYTNGTEARTALSRYFSFYNSRRSHQALEYRTPDEAFFAGLTVSTSVAA
jgi:transposase InsO family protein